MAKITPSILISGIQGRSEGTVFQMWKGQIISRRAVHPHQTTTPAHARYKGYVSDIAGCYYGLTATHKTSWACYANLLPTVMSGFNAFLGRNVTLLTAQHPDLIPYHCAPLTYTLPESPAPISASYCSFTERYCVGWTTPTDACYYIQGNYAYQVGYSNAKYPSWHFDETVKAARRFFDLEGSGFPTGTVIRFRARTLNIHGENSPWTDIASATKT